jgi:uncharacterized protein (TIGR02687 family)
MPNLDLEKVTEDLNRRFAAPLPEFYKRRIIFWYDEDREFEDKVDEVELENAKLVKLTGSNTFVIKKLLAEDDTVSNFVVYRPFTYEKDDDNWLLNVELYSEEFRSDLTSIWMDEMHIPSTTMFRSVVKSYRKYFNAKDRRAKFAALAEKKAVTSPSDVHLTVMASIAECETTPNAVLRSVLSAGIDNDSNNVYGELLSFSADTAFWSLVCQGTGYKEEKPNLGRLAAHILLTAATRTMRPEYLAGLDSYISIPHQSFCYDFVSEWLHSEENNKLYRIARSIEAELRIGQRFSQLSASDIADTECFPCVNICILRRLMSDISERLIDAETITQLCEKRRTKVWYDFVKPYYEGIQQIANMQAFYKEHSGGFHTVEPNKVWKEYTSTYYKMDTYYRLFQLAFIQSLKSSNAELDDLFKHDADIAEGLYKNWFLGELGGNWTKVCAEDLSKYGRILDVDRQEDFYQYNVKKADSRVFVIISDAMRYEVAASLADQLSRETQAKVELSSVQAIFPTITKFGMAALLPHKELTAEIRNDKLTVLADGSLTESNYREKILTAANPNSVALKYNDIIKAKRPERSEWVKGKDVVYIYHDTIDEASHTDDNSVFSACDDSIQEIKNLIRIIVNDFGATNIYVTSDHGFLYTYSPLTEDDKVDKTSFNSLDVEYGRRYAILHKGAAPQYLLPVKFLDGKSDFEAYAPRENVRIKMNGGGLNFVHGGISLQEMVVPVINYHFLRNSTKEYKNNKNKYDTKPVTLSLLSASRKISNMIFSLNFYQKEAVGPNREAATYLLYFTDASGKQISDTQKIIADKAGESSQDRTFRCGFSLKPLQYNNTSNYYLVIADETGLALPQKEEFQIDIAFAVDEFNFF